MRQNVWIWNHYATNMFFDQAGRHYWFAENLIEEGYKPIIFCASTNHFSDNHIDTKGSKYSLDSVNNIPFVFVNTPEYKGNGKKRVLNMISFYRGLFKTAKEYAELNGKPDVILASSVHPLTLVAGIKVAKKFGIPCICEVRDLWPESVVAYGSLKRKGILAKLLYKGEKWIYEKADKLVFTMEGGKDYILEQGWNKENGGPIDLDKVNHINNGVNLESFNYNKEKYQLEDEDINNPNIFKVVYTGSIRTVNKIGLLVDVSKKLKSKNVKFLIWGDGDQVEKIQQRIDEENLKNIVLKGRVDKKYIPNIVSKADLNVIMGETSQIFRFGLSPNKLFEYFAAGKPVLQTFKAQFSIVEKNKAGIELLESSVDSIVVTLNEFISFDDKEYLSYCENSSELAKTYDYEKLTNDLIIVIED